jgi:hypothetical protein
MGYIVAANSSINLTVAALGIDITSLADIPVWRVVDGAVNNASVTLTVAADGLSAIAAIGAAPTQLPTTRRIQVTGHLGDASVVVGLVDLLIVATPDVGLSVTVSGAGEAVTPPDQWLSTASSTLTGSLEATPNFGQAFYFAPSFDINNNVSFDFGLYKPTLVMASGICTNTVLRGFNINPTLSVLRTATGSTLYGMQDQPNVAGDWGVNLPDVISYAHTPGVLANGVHSVAQQQIIGLYIQPTVETLSSGVLTVNQVIGVDIGVTLEPAASTGVVTVSGRTGLHVRDVTTVGVGAINLGRNIGINIEDQSAGDAVYGVYSAISAGAGGRYAFFAAGDAPSQFNGPVVVGKTTPALDLTVYSEADNDSGVAVVSASAGTSAAAVVASINDLGHLLGHSIGSSAHSDFPDRAVLNAVGAALTVRTDQSDILLSVSGLETAHVQADAVVPLVPMYQGAISTAARYVTSGELLYAPVLASVSLRNQTTSVSGVLLLPSTAGVYRVGVYQLTTSGATAGTLATTVTWTDDAGNQSASPASNVNLGVLDSFGQGQAILRATTDAAIRYNAVLTGLVGAPVFNLYLTAERLM